MDCTYHFLEPVDALFLRGNKLFGDPGSFGESLVPPWPSVAAGAVRSALLVHRGYDPARFARGAISDAELGTPAQPGSFAVTEFRLARRRGDGRVETLYCMPADLSVTHVMAGPGEDRRLEVRRTRPYALPTGIEASVTTASLAVLPESARSKPLNGYWLTPAGWAAYRAGRHIDPDNHLVATSDLWTLDTRIGVAVDPGKRRAEDGALFTSQVVVFRQRDHDREGDVRDPSANYDVGFLVGVSGATLPDVMTLRFGGDGRAAVATRVASHPSQIDYEEIVAARRCRLILSTPGLFAGGWKPTGVTGSGSDLRFDLCGVRARLICAAVGRAEVISGWDLAARRPKPAQRVAPTGSVYWLDEMDTTADALHRLARRGLWSKSAEIETRRVEGFNRVAFATYVH